MYSPLNESEMMFDLENPSDITSTPETQSCSYSEHANAPLKGPERSFKPQGYKFSFSSLRKGSLAPILDIGEDFPDVQGRRPRTPDELCSSPTCTPSGQLAFIDSSSPDRSLRTVIKRPSMVFPNLWSGQPPSPEFDDATPSWLARKTSVASPPETPGKSLNVTTSSGPICRICHEGEQQEPLRSLCHCSGTMGLIHVSCLQRWLSSRNAQSCELCHHRFPTVLEGQTFTQWIRNADRNTRRAQWGDLICFMFLTPVALVSGMFIVKSATKQIVERRTLEASSLLVLGCVLLTAYAAWALLTLRFHRRVFHEWQKKNRRLRIDAQSRRPNSGELEDVAGMGASVEF
ncbi:E3 ubiquitin-protein ligase MARCHF3-like [Ornithodoros turicata]|uniref:E3 ubiquitin-protein ligase MARCHF3-like n=1 Tax=Ornithodoros turicata TaxID=34597 RepID=UPI00313922A4